MSSPIPGFRLLFPTSDNDTCLIYVPAEGVMGMFGRKREIRVKRTAAAVSGMERVLMLETPSWFVQGGIPGQIFSELRRWLFAG